MVLSSAKKVGTGLVKSANHKRKPYCSTAFIIIRQRRRKIVGQMLKIWILKKGKETFCFPFHFFLKKYFAERVAIFPGIVSPMINSFLSSTALILCKNDFNTVCPSRFGIVIFWNFLGHTVVVMAQQFEMSLQPLFSRDKISRLLQSSKMWALIYLGLLLLFKAIQAQDFVSLKIVLKLWLVIFMLVDLECKKC